MPIYITIFKDPPGFVPLHLKYKTFSGSCTLELNITCSMCKVRIPMGLKVFTVHIKPIQIYEITDPDQSHVCAAF